MISYPSRLFVSLPTLLVAFLFVAGPAFGGTAEDVSEVNSLLKRAEVNLNMVNQSIGHLTSPPKGAAGKLAKMRLGQALDDLNPAGELLGNLSAKNKGVAEATERYDTAAALASKLESILTGQPAKPAPKPGEAPAEPKPPKADGPKTVKLGYPHADNFKNVLFTLRHKVEGPANQITKLHAELLPIEDQLTINYRTAASTMTTITETRRQAGFVTDGFTSIPANGQGVAEAKQRLANALTQLDGSEAYFKPLSTQLNALVDPANYPEFNKDIKRLRELAQMYANPGYLFTENRTQAAEALAQGDAAKAECLRIAKAYNRLMQQQTEQGKHIEAVGNGFLSTHQAFLDAATEQKELLPASIREDLAEADKYATKAVETQKPMWFQGGIPQRMGWADDKLTLLTVLDPEGAPAVQKDVDAMKASLNLRADSLKELIIRENPLPNDNFEGEDRDAAIAIALSGWKIQQPDAEVLAIRIPSEAWKRNTKWTYSNGTWYFVDTSRIQVRLIVADHDNPAQAIDRPINVIKDHQQGDSMIGVPLRSFDEALQPSEYLLRDKIK